MANDASTQHEHRWFAQDEDEPANAYLVCIQCGEVVDPPTFLAMRAEVQQLKVARKDAMRETWQWVQKATRYEEHNDAAREVMARVAEGSLVRHPTRPLYSCPHCQATVDVSCASGPALPWAHGHIQHTHGCLVTEAREWLTKHEDSMDSENNEGQPQ